VLFVLPVRFAVLSDVKMKSSAQELDLIEVGGKMFVQNLVNALKGTSKKEIFAIQNAITVHQNA